MKRIAIIGLAGSGKSTFANRLGKTLNRPVVHLDREYWTGDWEKKYASKEHFKDFQRSIVNQDSWIIAGNYSSSLDLLLDRADTIIFFDFPKWRCLWRAFVRFFNRKQPFDKPEGMKEKFRWELVKFIVTYPVHELRKTVNSYRTRAKVFIVRNNREINLLFNQLTQQQ